MLVLGVIGMTKGKQSRFRLTVQKTSNKLYDRKPVTGNIQKAGTYQYYWFSNNASVGNPQAYWEHVVAVSTDSGSQADVDLFVSALDARYPSSEDFDFKSDNLGADDVIIRSTDPFWEKNGYGK